MKSIKNTLPTRFFNLLKDERSAQIIAFLGIIICFFSSLVFGIVTFYVAVTFFVAGEIWVYFKDISQKIYFRVSPLGLGGAYLLSLYTTMYANAQAGQINSAILFFIFTTSVAVSKDPKHKVDIFGKKGHGFLILLAISSIATELVKTMN